MKTICHRSKPLGVYAAASVLLGASLALVLLFSLSSATHAVDSHVIFVDKDAPGPGYDGLSWATAYTNVQDALDWTHIYSTTPYELWVAEGVYYPDEGGVHVANATTETFAIPYDNVRLYGGFAATETERTQRNWAAHPTILSGDMDGNDSNADGNFIAESAAAVQGSNARHVLYVGGGTDNVTGATVIDGFTITAGNADNQGGYGGGGIFCHGDGRSCSPTLANLVISGNSGSGMVNFAEHRGGSNPTLTDVLFRGNASASSGGGMENIANQSGVNPTLTNVIFAANSAADEGGGMANWAYEGSSSPRLSNVLFSGNRAGMIGGGLYTQAGKVADSSPWLVNVTFAGNDAGNGGAIFSFGDESFDVMASSNPVLINCIVWGNGGTEQIRDWRPGVYVRVWNSIVQGGLEGTSALNVNPRFVAPISASDAPTVTGNYRLLPDSPAIDAGRTLSVPAGIVTDLSGYARVVDSAVDLGAYEVQRPDLALRGDQQTAPVGSTFAQPLEVIAGSSFGDAVGPGLILTFTPPVAGPGLSVVVPFTLETNAAGLVSTTVAANDLAGSYAVTVTTRGEAAAQVFHLTNSPIPTTPYARADASAVLQDGSLLIDVLANDHAGDSPVLSVVGVTQPEGGGVTALEQNAVRFTPPARFTGSSRFTYTLQDGNGLTSSAGVVVTVAAAENSQGEPQTVLLDPAAGGDTTLVTPAGVTRITVPAGAIANPNPASAYTLIYRELRSPQPPFPSALFRLAGRTFVLDLFIDTVRQDGFTFAAPIQITLDYDPALVPDPSQLRLFYYDEQAGQWSNDGVTVTDVDNQKHTFRVRVAHLTQFAAASEPGDSQYELFLPALNR